MKLLKDRLKSINLRWLREFKGFLRATRVAVRGGEETRDAFLTQVELVTRETVSEATCSRAENPDEPGHVSWNTLVAYAGGLLGEPAADRGRPFDADVEKWVSALLNRFEEQRRQGPVLPRRVVLDIARALRAGPSPAVITLAEKTGAAEPAIGGFLMRWHDAYGLGLERLDVRTNPKRWVPSEVPGFGMPPASTGLTPPPEWLSECVKPYAKVLETETNKPKIRIVDEVHLPHSDGRLLELNIGGSSYGFARGYRLGMDKPVVDGAHRYESGLKEAYWADRRDLWDEWGGMVVCHVCVATSDDHVVLGQRSRNVSFAEGAWAATFEEQVDPHEEDDLFDAVERGLDQELHVHGRARHRGATDVRSIRLAAIGREWGEMWNTVALFVVRLNLTAAQVADRFSGASDQSEFKALATVPTGTPERRRALYGMITTGRVDVAKLAEIGAKFARQPGDSHFHSTTGVARLIFLLCAMYGTDTVHTECQPPAG